MSKQVMLRLTFNVLIGAVGLLLFVLGLQGCATKSRASGNASAQIVGLQTVIVTRDRRDLPDMTFPGVAVDIPTYVRVLNKKHFSIAPTAGVTMTTGLFKQSGAKDQSMSEDEGTMGEPHKVADWVVFWKSETIAKQEIWSLICYKGNAIVTLVAKHDSDDKQLTRSISEVIRCILLSWRLSENGARE